MVYCQDMENRTLTTGDHNLLIVNFSQQQRLIIMNDEILFGDWVERLFSDFN